MPERGFNHILQAMRGASTPSPESGGWASFVTGEEVRCPGPLVGSKTGLCRNRIGDVVAARIRVRLLPLGVTIGDPSLVHKCERCGRLLQIQQLPAQSAA